MSALNTEQARFNMIEQQIRPWEVLDHGVLALLSKVKREDFLPAAYKSLAFADMEIPLPEGQTMLTPKVEARMLQDLAVQPQHRVLEIGTGSGYMTALLAHRAKHVISYEIRPALADLARSNLRKAGINNVEVRVGDGSKIPLAEGSFDVIVLSGSVGQVPQFLLERLNVGGQLFAIVGEDPIMYAKLVRKSGATHYFTRELWETVAARLEHFTEPASFQF
jgi:protein-L-isoaspartate(D-aspartate) O-methyltransferase